MKNIKRTRRHFDFGKRFASLVEDLLPKNVCEVALATCYIELQGRGANGNVWGTGFRLYMMTHGESLRGINHYKSGNWVSINKAENLAAFLARFDLDLNHVIQYMGGIPSDFDKTRIDLVDLVETSCVC